MHFSETNLTSSDLTSSYNLHASRYDDETIWPDDEFLPQDFDVTSHNDLSALQDEEEVSIRDY